MVEVKFTSWETQHFQNISRHVRVVATVVTGPVLVTGLLVVVVWISRLDVAETNHKNKESKARPIRYTFEIPET